MTLNVFCYDFQIDMTALKQMRDNDLKELGIPMVYSFVSGYMIVCACKMFSCELAFRFLSPDTPTKIKNNRFVMQKKKIVAMNLGQIKYYVLCC